ncbi:methylmalonyl-CoA mutase [Chloroflexota bacterium]
MFDKKSLDRIEAKKKEWEEGVLKRQLDRFGIEESPNKFYTPLDIKDHDFLAEEGFPGEYPYTADIYPSSVPGTSGAGYGVSGPMARAGDYTGYGTAEDTRDFYKKLMGSHLRPGGPNLAFDLPTQCGHDSDDPVSLGEVGRVGVAVDTLRDMEIIYEPYVGPNDLDKIVSNFTINAPCNIIIAMYIALAEKRGIPLSKLRGTPQNDILKEFTARGTYIFPPKPSMRMERDSITYFTKHLPSMNILSICGYHMREAGGTAAQVLAFTLSHGMAYVQLGIDAGLDVDDFVHRLTFLNLGGGMKFFTEIALNRAARRMWAGIMKERFKAKNPRSLLYRPASAAFVGAVNTTMQRPLNNLTRSVIGGVMSALSGGRGDVRPRYDEPLGLGHSFEAYQLQRDATRIIQYEAELCDVIDPLAGSYYVEALTNKIEAEAWEIIKKIDAIGGAVAAIEEGFTQREIAKSSYQYQSAIERGEEVIVGVNKFTGEEELDIRVSRLVEHPYDPTKREEAEERQIANLTKIKKERSNQAVQSTLKQLHKAAQDENENLIPHILEAVKAYATIGEISDVLRAVFGEYEASGIV